MARNRRLVLAAHISLALAAAALGILFSFTFGIPPYTFQMALVVIATLIPIEFVAIIVWDSAKKRKSRMHQGILPPRTRTR